MPHKIHTRYCRKSRPTLQTLKSQVVSEHSLFPLDLREVDGSVSADFEVVGLEFADSVSGLDGSSQFQFWHIW